MHPCHRVHSARRNMHIGEGAHAYAWAAARAREVAVEHTKSGHGYSGSLYNNKTINYLIFSGTHSPLPKHSYVAYLFADMVFMSSRLRLPTGKFQAATKAAWNYRWKRKSTLENGKAIR
jgi:hypothetical protein